MKKVGIITGIIITVLAAIILLITGVIQMNKQNEKEQLIEIVSSNEVTKLVEENLKADDPNALTSNGIIQSYYIDKDSIERNPMGGIMFTIIINSDKDLYIHSGVDKDGTTDKLELFGATVYSQKLDKLLQKGDSK